MWTKAGGTGAYNPDAFYRGENGNMLMKEGFIKAPSTPTTTTTGTTILGQIEIIFLDSIQPS